MLTLHIPSRTIEAARRVAYAVEAGRLPCLPHYRGEALAQAQAANLTALHAEPFRVYTFILASHATHDGRIKVARLVDRAGEMAAALMLFVAAPALAAANWGWLA